MCYNNFTKKRRLKKLPSIFFCSILIYIFSCTRINLYEKVTPIPAHKWTSASYQPFLILRHNDKYNYNNIWLNIFIKNPDNSIQKFQIEEVLATNTGWRGTGMDDIYEHRLPLTPKAIQFRKPGGYMFSIEQIMREDPLENVMDVGLRLEKKP
jgi:gliding motility-associated lipoprotein GldH